MIKKNSLTGFTASRRYKKLRAMVVINIFLLIANIVSYVFVTGPGILRGKAAEVSFNITVCPATGSCIVTTYYRFANNQCTAVSIFPSQAGANDYATLAECETQIVSPTPTPTPTPTSAGVPGYAPPGLVAHPYKEENIFVPTERGLIPYIKIIQVSGVEVVPEKLTRVYNREPKFIGATNLRNAILFLQFDYEPKKVYIAFADDNGMFSFQFPMLLDIGPHAVFITAMSPVNPYFRGELLFTFEIIPIEREQPGQRPIATPSASPAPFPTIAPVPSVSLYPLPLPPKSGGLPILPHDWSGKPPALKPIIISDTFYSVNVTVDGESKNIYPGKTIYFHTKISRIFQNIIGEEAIPLRYYIIAPDGKIVFDRTEQLLVKNMVNTLSRLSTSYGMPLGKYTIVAEIPAKDMVFASTDTFEVREQVFAIAPGLAVSLSMIAKILLRTLWILLALLLLFLLLLYLEHRRCKEAPQINEKDLYKDKDIT